MNRILRSFISAVAALVLLPALLRAESIVDAAALKAPSNAFEQKVSQIQNAAIRSDLEQALAKFKVSTARILQLAEVVDAAAAREQLLMVDSQAKIAAMRQLQERKKQATADLDRWLENWGREVVIHNANLPTFRADQNAERAAFVARVNAENAEKDRKLAEKKRIEDQIAIEGKPIGEAYRAALTAAGVASEEQDKAMKPLYAEYKTWQEQKVWITAAIDVAASGGNPASALTPFPGGGPQAVSLAAPNAVPAGTNVNAGAQLRSVETHSATAVPAANREEAGKGFDTSGRESGSLVSAGTSAGRPAPAFISSLPDTARNDAQVQQSLAYYQHLDGLKADTAAKIAAVEAEQKAGKGDGAILSVKVETLKNQLKQDEADQASAKETMKKRVKDLGFDWNEAPATPAAETAPR